MLEWWKTRCAVLHYSNIPSFHCSSFHHHFIRPTHFSEAHVDTFGVGGGDIFADEIGFDRQLAMAAVDEHCELNPLRAAKVIERVHRRANRAPAEEHIIDQ